MRKLALVLTLMPLAACSTFGWEGQSRNNLTQSGIELASPAALSSAYNSEQFFREVRRRSDGRNNAFGRDLMAISNFIDRHFWNYDVNDMYVNYPSDTTKLEHVGRFGMTVVSGLPLVDEVTNR